MKLAHLADPESTQLIADLRWVVENLGDPPTVEHLDLETCEFVVRTIRRALQAGIDIPSFVAFHRST